MEKYKEDLIDYLIIRKNKKRDFITYTTSLNVRLISLLQQLKDDFECYEDFVVDMRRKRFLEMVTFPIAAAELLVKYDDQDLVEYNFKWLLDDQGTGLLLHCIVLNRVHQNFDSELLKSFDTPPEWLTNCEYCTPCHKNLGNADEFSEEKVAEFIIDTFRKMTQNFLV
ncbi:MAG: hypothetical protein NTU44_00420 [Bacteroidetes bacterium]|nr:hypothetical protein [Bacteroidota bacterium]